MGLLILQLYYSTMIIHEGYENLELVKPVVTLGVFDGVHKGHQTLIERLILRAHENKGESVVITFMPHPRLVLDKNHDNLSFLTTLEEKKILLGNAGIDHLIIVEFTKKFSKLSACDFIKKVLVAKIATKNLIIGFNHHFGRRGEGDFNTIVRCAESLDFEVEQVMGFQMEEGAISSSLIREALLSGRIDNAKKWLGYSYSITGTIVSGRKIGREIGYPTANIKPDDKYKLIPANGVYAVEVIIDDVKFPGMLSIGSNPTVNSDGSVRSIEVHILDFDGDIYGRSITVRFVKWLRDEKKFRSKEQLAEQMKLDRKDVMRLFT